MSIEIKHKVTRVEVIDWRNPADSKRAFVEWDESMVVQLEYQDDGRTLKVFLTRPNK